MAWSGVVLVFMIRLSAVDRVILMTSPVQGRALHTRRQAAPGPDAAERAEDSSRHAADGAGTVACGRAGRGSFAVRGDDDQPIAQSEMRFALPELNSHVTNVHMFGGVQFQQFGVHHVEIFLENELRLRFPLPVMRVTLPQPQ